MGENYSTGGESDRCTGRQVGRWCYDAEHEPHPALSMSALLRRHLDLLLLSVIGVLLVTFPQIDLAIASLFHEPFDGFYLR